VSLPLFLPLAVHGFFIEKNKVKNQLDTNKSPSLLKALRDIAHQQMLLDRKLDSPDTYAAAKAIYSALCADYFDLMQGDTQ